MKPFGFTTFMKASLLILIIFISYVVATEIGSKPSISEKKAGKAISRGEPHIGVSFINFKEDKFSYLNITILGYSHVDWMPQCSFACLETPTCFSYNLAAYPDINGKLLCELLPSDKYNNSDKFISNESFHHFSITSSCSGWPCKNNGTCLPLYEENSYKCICKAGFTGRDCENDIDECSSENECDVTATCTNTIGYYNCTCKKGYGGDGRNCSDIDECSTENECDVNAMCANTIGSYKCTCKKGYEGDGRNCSDIDECSTENECHMNANCTNTIGSYNCTCKKGYGGDGRNCSALMNSVILSSDGIYLRHLAMFLSPLVGDHSRWGLCYRSSTHGPSDRTFHRNCDGKSNTVTIVKKNDFVFGGFTAIPWESPGNGNGKFGTTEKAFIFSLRNAEGLPPFKSNVKDPSKAIHNVGHVGPTFGENDLLIDRISATSSSNFGDNYVVPTGVQNRLTLLAGASTFEEDEVEVFFLL
ncbi:protein slit-like [Montipora foliosa]|uniref:protein slit-like n=1 Tax=Montipora foliosa TaxID=591990 RepID=UPI0035F127B2